MLGGPAAHLSELSPYFLWNYTDCNEVLVNLGSLPIDSPNKSAARRAVGKSNPGFSTTK